MARFSHAYTIAFTVESEKEDGSDVTPAMFCAALDRRRRDLNGTVSPERPEGEWDEATGAPYDTYEIDQG